MKIQKYTPQDKNIWDDFLNKSKNATFLFQRDFMDYHAHRFQDHSLLIFNSKNQLCALFPACENEQIIYSHQGLSYGGVIFKNDIRLETAIQVFQTILEYFKRLDFAEIIYKQVPYFYYQLPNYEEDTILFRLNATLFRKEIGAIIDLRKSDFLKISTQRKRDIKKAQKAQIIVSESSDFTTFWNEILMPNLWERHHKKPTHSLSEIKLLAQNFPNNIKLFSAFQQNKMVAGVVLFNDKKVIHSQYISSNIIGKNTGALSLIFYELIFEKYKNQDFFSFGISTEQNGTKLNYGLHHWKETFGARAFPHNFYRISTDAQMKF